MNNKRHVKPRGFEHFAIAEVALPCKPWRRLYDIEHEIIWINTAVEEECGVIKMVPARW